MLKFFCLQNIIVKTVLQNVGPNRLISKDTESGRIQHQAEQSTVTLRISVQKTLWYLLNIEENKRYG